MDHYVDSRVVDLIDQLFRAAAYIIWKFGKKIASKTIILPIIDQLLALIYFTCGGDIRSLENSLSPSGFMKKKGLWETE